ncbi:PTS sugar transporter subunit IIA, partial [Deinococcus pimensis]|uniref:PTS sugar transporter subunit IIA n=1 Tax=Deinococcus pimensis TaxID=309888 RepID=UPI0005EB6F55
MTELPRQLIRLGAHARDKGDAIAQAAGLLAANGNIEPSYLQGMLDRETQANTYLGAGIAIPHGTPATRHLVRRTGIAVVQLPEGVAWGEGGERVRLVVGIA